MSWELLLAAALGFAAGALTAMRFAPEFRRARNRLVGPIVDVTRQSPAGATVLDSLQELLIWAQLQRPSLSQMTAEDGSVTLLFTDIERSTEMQEQLGDEGWLALLTEHNEVARSCVAAEGGIEVKSQGDGLMIAFPGPDAGLRSAIQMQAELTELNESRQGALGRVRMGLHTGPAIEAEADLHGRTVVIAARLAAYAAGGEVLLTGNLRNRLESPEHHLAYLGRVRLKGISTRQEVYRAGLGHPAGRDRRGDGKPIMADILSGTFRRLAPWKGRS